MSNSITIGQRFTQLIQQLGLSKNAFAQSLDRTATVIQHLVDERNKPGYDLLCRVFEVYPNVSKDWLLLGNGPMLLRTEAPGLFTGDEAVASPAAQAIDLAAVAGPSRRRAATALQPADVTATVTLAASQAAKASQADQEYAQPAQLNTPPVQPTVLPAASVPQLPAATAAPAPPVSVSAPDPSYLAALLQAQHVQHQLALSEQRNQHLLEQQQLLQQMVQLLQRTS